MRAFLVPALEAAFAVQGLRAKSPALTIAEAVNALRLGPVEDANHDYDNGVAIIEHLSESFFDEVTALPRASGWRRALRRLALEIFPLWVIRLPSGRETAIAAMDADTIQCLAYAELIDRPLDQEGIDWWDGLAAEIRRRNDQERLRTGRIGERLSYDHEVARLKPENLHGRVIWSAIENNSLGYDITSCVKIGESIFDRFIEVKACQFEPPMFYFTRHEWDIAEQKGTTYLVHVWALPSSTLITLTFDELRSHIPSDSISGKGKWNKVKVSL